LGGAGAVIGRIAYGSFPSFTLIIIVSSVQGVGKARDDGMEGDGNSGYSAS
jgi:hypothetical protein